MIIDCSDAEPHKQTISSFVDRSYRTTLGAGYMDGLQITGGPEAGFERYFSIHSSKPTEHAQYIVAPHTE